MKDIILRYTHDFLNNRIDNEKQREIWNGFMVMNKLNNIKILGTEEHYSTTLTGDIVENFIDYYFSNELDSWGMYHIYIVMLYGKIKQVSVSDKRCQELIKVDIEKNEDLKNVLDKALDIINGK